MEHRPGHGAKQPYIFSHERADWLDEPEREDWIPTDALIELLDAPSGARALDFGTGTGRYALALARTRPDAHVVAYDVQPEMLEIARRRIADSQIENIDVADWAIAQRRAPYDRILALNVLHEIDNDTLRRLASLLTAGGNALIIDWDATVERPTGPPAEHAHSPDEAQARLAHNGLRCTERIRDARFPYHFIFRAERSMANCCTRVSQQVHSSAPTLQTVRLTLRPHRTGDLDACAAMWADPIVTRHIGGKASTRRETWMRMLRYAGLWGMLGWGYWAVEERTGGTFVGDVGFADFHREMQPSIAGIPEAGWVLDPKFYGRGYATEALLAALEWGDANIGCDRTVCIVAPENAASIRVAEKAGYVETARTVYNGEPTILFTRAQRQGAAILT